MNYTRMKFLIINLFIICVNGDYWQQREDLLKKEESLLVGNQIKLSSKEDVVNKMLMNAKRKELKDGFKNPENFPPAVHFFKAKKSIEESQVFKFIRKMPKGGALHLHDTAMTSVDYVLKNITYRDHLLICQTENEVKLVFADPPPKDDCWKSVKSIREEENGSDSFDNWLKGKLTLVRNNPDTAYPNINEVWKVFQAIFDFQTSMIMYRPVFEDYFYKGLEEMYTDNVNYVEIRGSLPLMYELNGWPLNHVQVLERLNEVVKQFQKDHPDFWGIKYIYAPHRKVDSEIINEYLQIFKQMKSLYPDFLVGFDLVGQEDLGNPLIEFIQTLQQSSDDVKFYFHAGETNWNGMSSDANLIDAILLNTTRIGHGFAALKHVTVLEEIKRRGIAVEVCPISHQVLNLIKDLRNHPASFFLANDYPVVISADDPGLWGASGLSYDFYEAFMGLASSSADLKMLKQLALNSLIYSSLTPTEKGETILKFMHQWDQFINDLYLNGLHN